MSNAILTILVTTIQETMINIAASSHYRGQAQEAATYAKMARSGRPTAARSN